MIGDDLGELFEKTQFDNENVVNEKIEKGDEINDRFHRSNSRKMFTGRRRVRDFIDQCQFFLRHEQIERRKKIFAKNCSAPFRIEFLFRVNSLFQSRERGRMKKKYVRVCSVVSEAN